MAKKIEHLVNEQLNNVEFQNAETEKKTFIEPELSPAVDVLEATTFFQAVTSGATN